MYFISDTAPSCLFLVKMSHLTFSIMHLETGDNSLLTQREPLFQGFHEQQLSSLQLNVNLLRDLSFSDSDHPFSPKQNQRSSKSVLVFLKALFITGSRIRAHRTDRQILCNLSWQSFPSTACQCAGKLGWSRLNNLDGHKRPSPFYSSQIAE